MKRLLPFLALCLIVGGLFLSGDLEFLENRLADARFRLISRTADPGLLLVTIDTETLEAGGVSPPSRASHARVLEILQSAGASKVAFNVDLASPTTEPDDLRLQRALEAARGPVILAIFQDWIREDDAEGAFLRTAAPLPRFRDNAQLATINLRPDRDGLTRNYLMRGTVAGARVPSLAAALTGINDSELEGFGIDFGIDAGSFDRISYSDLLSGAFAAGKIADRTVLVGVTARELAKHVSVPRYGTLPGCLVQALATESLAQGRTLDGAGPVVAIFGILLLGLLAGPRIESSSWRWGLSWMTVLVVGLFVLSVAIQAKLPYTLDVTPWMLTVGSAYGFGLVRRIDQQALRILIQGRQIRRTESLMRHVVANSLDPIITFTEDGTLETLNPAARRMFGIKPTECVDRTVSELLDIGDADPFTSCEVTAHRSDGMHFPVEVVVSTIVSDGERRRVAFVRDITERKAQQELLQYQATHDPLTDLPNRYLLQDCLEHMLIDASQESYGVAFLLLDLDRFKEINDALGHRIGDLLLREIPGRMSSVLPDSATLGRLGGDEFAVLLPRSPADQALGIARELRNALEEPICIQGLALHISATVGVAMFPDHCSDATELVQRADVAMYQAKQDRSGLALYEAERDGTSVRLLTLNGELRKAIDENRLSLSYQPKICSKTGEVLGVEALVRWIHPEQGNIPPDDFIGMAEQSGLIRPLTQWILKTALLQGALWHASGLQIGVSINISARNLLEEELPRMLAGMLRDSGMPAAHVTLEVTESVIMTDPEAALVVITELSDLGVSISIDDFGTGYSSLGYLKKLPAREIKIDRSFVKDMHREKDDAAIVASTIELAHNLGLSVVAEGVETEEIWQLLRDLGCDVGQGYLFSPAQPPDKITVWIRQHESQQRPVGAVSD